MKKSGGVDDEKLGKLEFKPSFSEIVSSHLKFIKF